MSININNDGLSFGSYKNALKTLFKKGKFPSVKKGLYGEKLTVANASLEHLKPHSLGGQTITSNLALASKELNNARGNQPLTSVLTYKQLEAYLRQFNFKIHGFDGYKYQKEIKKTCEALGIVKKQNKR